MFLRNFGPILLALVLALSFAATGAAAATADSILANKKARAQPTQTGASSFSTPRINANKRLQTRNGVRPDIMRKPCPTRNISYNLCQFGKVLKCRESSGGLVCNSVKVCLKTGRNC